MAVQQRVYNILQLAQQNIHFKGTCENSVVFALLANIRKYFFLVLIQVDSIELILILKIYKCFHGRKIIVKLNEM